MSYTPTEWKDRAVERPRTFTMQNNPDGTITLIPAPGAIAEPGTPVNAANLNNLEQGLVAHLADVATHNNITPGESTFCKVKEYLNIGNEVIRQLIKDSYYYYVVSGNTVYQLDKNDFSIVASFSFSFMCTGITMDTNYIYGTFNGASGNSGFIKKLNKSGLLEVATSQNLGGTSYVGVVSDDTHVYITTGLSASCVIKKYSKSNLALVATSPPYGGDINALEVDEEYIYAGGKTTLAVCQYNKSNLVSTHTFPKVSSEINRIYIDNLYIYVAASNYIYRYHKTSKTLDIRAALPISGITNIVVDGYVYVTSTRIVRLNYENLSILKISDDFATGVRCFISEGDKYYIAGVQHYGIWEIQELVPLFMQGVGK